MRFYSIEQIEKDGGKVLRYTTGSPGYWLIRLVAIARNIPIESIRAARISNRDHWVIVQCPGYEGQTFTDRPLLP